MASASVHFHLQPGVTLQDGKYRIESLLGQGGFGITYLAEHKSFGKVALKELFLNSGAVQCTRENTTQKTVIPNFERELFEKFKTRFEEEARILFSLGDVEGVVKVLDIFEENGTSYFSMEFLDGEKLDDYVLNRAPLPVAEGVRITKAIGNTLSIIHERKMLHRDIKPSNIIITKKGRITLIDFGIAKNNFEEVETHTTFHSPRYAPPEQKIAKNKMGSYSDVYALGATAYFIFTANPPQNIEERVTEDYLPPRHFSTLLPESINTAINRSLEIKIENRYKTVEEFLTALKADDTLPELKPEVAPSPVPDASFIEGLEKAPTSGIGETRFDPIPAFSVKTADTAHEAILDPNATIIDSKKTSDASYIPPAPIFKNRPRRALIVLAAVGFLGILALFSIYLGRKRGAASETGYKENISIPVSDSPTFVLPVLKKTEKPITPSTQIKSPAKKTPPQGDVAKEIIHNAAPDEKVNPPEPVKPIEKKLSRVEVCADDVTGVKVEIYNSVNNLMEKFSLEGNKSVDVSILVKGEYTLKCFRGGEIICIKKFQISL